MFRTHNNFPRIKKNAFLYLSPSVLERNQASLQLRLKYAIETFLKSNVKGECARNAQERHGKAKRK